MVCFLYITNKAAVRFIKRNMSLFFGVSDIH